MFQGSPPRFDHGVRELQLREGQQPAQDARVDQFVDLGVHVPHALIREDDGSVRRRDGNSREKVPNVRGDSSARSPAPTAAARTSGHGRVIVTVVASIVSSASGAYWCVTPSGGSATAMGSAPCGYRSAIPWATRRLPSRRGRGWSSSRWCGRSRRVRRRLRTGTGFGRRFPGPARRYAGFEDQGGDVVTELEAAFGGSPAFWSQRRSSGCFSGGGPCWSLVPADSLTVRLGRSMDWTCSRRSARLCRTERHPGFRPSRLRTGRSDHRGPGLQHEGARARASRAMGKTTEPFSRDHLNVGVAGCRRRPGCQCGFPHDTVGSPGR